MVPPTTLRSHEELVWGNMNEFSVINIYKYI